MNDYTPVTDQEIVLKYNQELFNKSIEPEYHDIIVAIKVSKNNRNILCRRTQPTKYALEMGIRPAYYIKTIIKKPTTTPTIKHTYVMKRIFKNKELDLYNFIRMQVENKAYTLINNLVIPSIHIDQEPEEEILLLLKYGISGKIINLQTPLYQVTLTDTKGELHKIPSVRYNSKTDNWERTQLLSSKIKFFVCEDELHYLRDIAIRLYRRLARPYLAQEILIDQIMKPVKSSFIKNITQAIKHHFNKGGEQ